MIEIRPFEGGANLGEKASAFARAGNSAGALYLLIVWIDGTPFGDQSVTGEGEVWRQDLEARGLHVLGSALEGPDTATTVRVRDGETLISDGPFTETNQFVAGIDVVTCADRQQAIELAAAHPMAGYHATGTWLRNARRRRSPRRSDAGRGTASRNAPAPG